MKKKLLSVIIPVYNVEKYIEKCLESVINQTYKNIEIILINDGSTDSSLEKCEIFAKKDDRINLITKKNEGLAATRNLGIELSKGDYVTFLDSDDYIHELMYEELIKNLEENNVDISACRSRDVNENHSYHLDQEVFNNKLKIFNTQEIFEGLFEQKEVRFEVWNKVFKREVIGTTRFIVGQTYEDIHFDREIFFKANTYVCTNNIMHFYLISREGNTNSSFNEARLSSLKELKKLSEELKEHQYEDGYYKVNLYILNFCISLYLIAKKNNASKNSMKEIRLFYREYYLKTGFFKKNTNLKFKLKTILFFISPSLFYGMYTRGKI